MNPSRGRDNYEEPEHMRKLFIGGLDFRTDDCSLREFFEQWGQVVDVIVMKDPQTKRSRGFGFITYSRAYMADDAQDARPHRIDGRLVESKLAVPRNEIKRADAVSVGEMNEDAEDSKDCYNSDGSNVSVAEEMKSSGGGDDYEEPEHMRKLFIGGLDFRTNESSLKGFYRQWGKIVDVVVMIDPHTNRSRGFGFITYSRAHMVDDALEAIPHRIDGRVVEPKRAVPKDKIKRADAVFVIENKQDEEEDLNDYYIYNSGGRIVSVSLVTEKLWALGLWIKSLCTMPDYMAISICMPNLIQIRSIIPA